MMTLSQIEGKFKELDTREKLVRRYFEPVKSKSKSKTVSKKRSTPVRHRFADVIERDTDIADGVSIEKIDWTSTKARRKKISRSALPAAEKEIVHEFHPSSREVVQRVNTVDALLAHRKEIRRTEEARQGRRVKNELARGDRPASSLGLSHYRGESNAQNAQQSMRPTSRGNTEPSLFNPSAGETEPTVRSYLEIPSSNPLDSHKGNRQRSGSIVSSTSHGSGKSRSSSRRGSLVDHSANTAFLERLRGRLDDADNGSDHLGEHDSSKYDREDGADYGWDAGYGGQSGPMTQGSPEGVNPDMYQWFQTTSVKVDDAAMVRQSLSSSSSPSKFPSAPATRREAAAPPQALSFPERVIALSTDTWSSITRHIEKRGSVLLQSVTDSMQSEADSEPAPVMLRSESRLRDASAAEGDFLTSLFPEDEHSRAYRIPTRLRPRFVASASAQRPSESREDSVNASEMPLPPAAAEESESIVLSVPLSGGLSGVEKEEPSISSLLSVSKKDQHDRHIPGIDFDGDLDPEQNQDDDDITSRSEAMSANSETFEEQMIIPILKTTKTKPSNYLDDNNDDNDYDESTLSHGRHPQAGHSFPRASPRPMDQGNTIHDAKIGTWQHDEGGTSATGTDLPEGVDAVITPDMDEFYFINVRVEYEQELTHWRFDVHLSDAVHKHQRVSCKQVRVNDDNYIVFKEPGTVVLNPVKAFPWVVKPRDLYGHTLRLEVVGVHPRRTRIVDSFIYFGDDHSEEPLIQGGGGIGKPSRPISAGVKRGTVSKSTPNSPRRGKSASTRQGPLHSAGKKRRATSAAGARQATTLLSMASAEVQPPVSVTKLSQVPKGLFLSAQTQPSSSRKKTYPKVPGITVPKGSFDRRLVSPHDPSPKSSDPHLPGGASDKEGAPDGGSAGEPPAGQRDLATIRSAIKEQLLDQQAKLRAALEA
jgi:hypothetical protein